jgi:hypothetical protein
MSKPEPLINQNPVYIELKIKFQCMKSFINLRRVLRYQMGIYNQNPKKEEEQTT